MQPGEREDGGRRSGAILNSPSECMTFGIDPAHAAQKACKRAIRRELGECHLGKAGNVSVAHPFRGQQSAQKVGGATR
jgi:hypothetical protein